MAKGQVDDQIVEFEMEQPTPVGVISDIYLGSRRDDAYHNAVDIVATAQGAEKMPACLSTGWNKKGDDKDWVEVKSEEPEHDQASLRWGPLEPGDYWLRLSGAGEVVHHHFTIKER